MRSMASGATLASPLVLVLAAYLSVPPGAAGQEPEAIAEAVAPAPAGLPVFATLGFAFGQRRDGCALCVSPDDDESFSAHLSVGKYLVGGLGVGVDGSMWKRSRPIGPGAVAAGDAEAPTALANTLGNASLVFSVERWHLFVRGGGGLAWGSQDTTESDSDGEISVVPLSGMGIGYTVGAGLTLPLHPMVSLAFFGNYNVGRYDLSSPGGAVHRDAMHEVVELGVGVTLRE